MRTPHLPALATAFSLFISPANAGQNFKLMQSAKIELTEEQVRKKGDCLIWFLAEYTGNPQGLSAQTILRWYGEKFREQRPKAHELARKLGILTQP